MEFFRKKYWSGLLFPSPGYLPDPGTEHGSPALQADSSEHQGSLLLRDISKYKGRSILKSIRRYVFDFILQSTGNTLEYVMNPYTFSKGIPETEAAIKL